MIVHHFEEIDSTNEQAKREVAQGAIHETVIRADSQTAGKGRRGRTWESPKGCNLYFSLIVRPDIVPDKASMLTLVMALAVTNVLEEISEGKKATCKPKIKWPNDIVINGRKVCGILTELTLKEKAIDAVIIGVGINVGKQKFGPELTDKATDMETEWGIRLSCDELLGNIINAFRQYYTVFLQKGSFEDLQEEYNRLLINRGREVCVLEPSGEYRGIATGINEKGELHIRLPEGGETYIYAGEVSVRGIYGYV